MRAYIILSFLFAVFCAVYAAPQLVESDEVVIDRQDFNDCDKKTACTDGEEVWWCDKKGAKPKKVDEEICVPYDRWFPCAICTDCENIRFVF